MKIVVAGCGKIGTEIIASLVAEEHDVIAIDEDRSVLDEVGDTYDIAVVEGNCADILVLKDAGCEDCDLFVAVTGSDEVNMLSSFFAKAQGAKHTAARIRNPEYSEDGMRFIRDRLQINLRLNPDQHTAEEIFNIIQFPSAFKIETFSRRYFRIAEVRLKEQSVLDNVKISDLKRSSKCMFLICAVQRGDRVYIPDGDFVLKSGDKIGIAGTPADLYDLLRSLKLLQREIKDVMIIGGSRTAFYLIRKLLADTKCTVKLIDSDKEKCEAFSAGFAKLDVVCGDATNHELLNEEGIAKMDAVINLTGLDETNILMGYYANSIGVDKVIAKVNHKEFTDTAEKIGLDCVVSPQDIVADIVVRNARSYETSGDNDIDYLYSMMDDMIEALEFRVKPDFPCLNVALKDMSIKKDILVAGIIRDKLAIIPSGSDCLKAGDQVVIISGNQHHLTTLSQILKQ